MNITEVNPTIFPALNKGDKVLIKVDISEMTKEAAGEYMNDIHEQMTEKFPDHAVIVYPSNYEFYILPEPLAEYPKAKMVLVADL